MDELEPDIRTFQIPPEGIDRLDTWLTGLCEGFSRARVQGLMKAGRVTVAGAVCTRATATVQPGDVVTLEIPPPIPAEPQPEDIPLSILFEDDDLLALDKPAGLVVHPAPGHLTGTLVNALLHHCPSLSGIGGVARPGIVHRLDQDTSGVMVVAKSQRAMDTLTREFASHANLRKTYLALVHGVPSPSAGRIENLIGRCPFDRKKMAVVERNGKIAVTNYAVIPNGTTHPRLTLVQC
ncbi:MAG: pseudouridine synthase, partial [Kiritimatiellia bacterium]